MFGLPKKAVDDLVWTCRICSHLVSCWQPGVSHSRRTACILNQGFISEGSFATRDGLCVLPLGIELTWKLDKLGVLKRFATKIGNLRVVGALGAEIVWWAIRAILKWRCCMRLHKRGSKETKAHHRGSLYFERGWSFSYLWFVYFAGSTRADFSSYVASAQKVIALRTLKLGTCKPSL